MSDGQHPATVNSSSSLLLSLSASSSEFSGLVQTTLSAAANATGATDDLPPSEGRYTLVEAVLIGLVLSVFIFFSIAGNVLVCIAVLTDRTLRKRSNYFIMSLALADMLVAVLVMTFAVANDILGYWVFGQHFCSVWISLDIMCSTASILNLCAISLDRYIHIRNPLHYEQWVTPSRIYASIALLWVLSALISFVPIHLGWHQLGMDLGTDASTHSPLHNTDANRSSMTSPSERYICLMELNPWYAVVSSLVSFYAPCVVMITIYIKLYHYARMHVKTIKRTMATPLPADGSDQRPSSQYKLSDHKAAITLGIIMGVFLFCWTPFFTINIVVAFCTTCIPGVVFSAFTWLGYFNSTLNPIIYSIFNQEFREAFKKVLSFPHCLKWRDLEFGKPIKFNHFSRASEYGAVPNKSPSNSGNKGLEERITCL